MSVIKKPIHKGNVISQNVCKYRISSIAIFVAQKHIFLFAALWEGSGSALVGRCSPIERHGIVMCALAQSELPWPGRQK